MQPKSIDKDDAMAKATASAKVKAAPPKKAKAATPEKTAAAKKGAAPKMAPAPTKKAAAKAKAPAPVPKKVALKKGAPPKMAAPRDVGPSKKTATKKVAERVVAVKKAASKEVGRPKVATRAKSVAVKKAEPRRPATRVAVPIPVARRGRPPAAVRTGPSRKLSANGPQVFAVSHLREADFKADGLRPYAQYRDLGIAAATGGLCQAHVIRLVPPCTDEVRKRHLHKAELQLVYVLKGWVKNEFEGQGEQMMSEGSCWLQPSGVEHTVLDYSSDCELLEIIVPADFKTEDAV